MKLHFLIQDLVVVVQVEQEIFQLIVNPQHLFKVMMEEMDKKIQELVFMLVAVAVELELLVKMELLMLEMVV